MDRNELSIGWMNDAFAMETSIAQVLENHGRMRRTAQRSKRGSSSTLRKPGATPKTRSAPDTRLEAR